MTTVEQPNTVNCEWFEHDDIKSKGVSLNMVFNLNPHLRPIREYAETETVVVLKSNTRLKRIANEKHYVLFSLVGEELIPELKKMIEGDLNFLLSLKDFNLFLEINGSVLLTTRGYDPKTTMLIFGKDPIRNEKISSSIVSGVPCLHHSYVRKSYHQNNK